MLYIVVDRLLRKVASEVALRQDGYLLHNVHAMWF